MVAGMLPGMILAAGLGTRLRPLTDVCPKPLVPVGDRSVLAGVVTRLRSAGVERLVVNSHHLPFALRDAAAELGVELSAEADLLGTAGGVAHARGHLGQGPALLWNGDVMADIDLQGLVAEHDRRAPGATLVVMPRPGREGNVGLAEDGRVVRLRAESVATEVRSADFAGVHVIGAALRAGLPERGCLVGDVYIPALRAGAVLRTVEHHGAWHDIGNVAAYLEANLAWLRARSSKSWIGAGARLDAGVLLEDAIVGPGATVTGEGLLVNCVVWPGATALAPAHDAVFAPGLRVEKS
jgi:mannose-1-phosphate guanylyltransferase